MKRKNIKYYVIAVFLLIVVIALSIPFLIAEFQLNAEIEKLREESIPVTIQEFADKYYKLVPESQNAAVTFNKAFSLLPYTFHKCACHGSEKKQFNASVEDRICYKLSPEELENAKKYVEESTAFFNEMEKIKKYKFIRFLYKWQDANEVEMPELNNFRIMIELYTIKAELATNHNNPQQTYELFKKMFNITRFANQNPLRLGQILFYAYDAIVLKKLERAMSIGQFSSEQLKSFVNIFNKHELLVVKGWPLMWEWELACFLANKNKFFHDSSESIKEKLKYDYLYYGGNLTAMFIEGIKILRKTIDIPVEIYIKQKKNLEGIENKMPWGLISSPKGMYLTALKAVARLRCAKTACAVERFRLKYGKFPIKLKQLVPEFLNRVPVDPFDGKDIRYFCSNFDIKYEVQVKVKKKPKTHEKQIPSEITDIFGSGEIPEESKYKIVEIKKTGFQVYSVGENLKDEKSSLIIDKQSSVIFGDGFGVKDDITFTVLDK